MPRRAVAPLALLAIACGVGAGPGPGGAVSRASACARDGVPSLSADGRLAVLTRSGGKARLLPASYAPFGFARAARRARPVALAENNAEVRLTLPAAVFGRPWRWDFGDGTPPGYGTHVRHAFARPGAYRVTVLAYYPSYGVWEPFDLATMQVR